MGDLSPSTKLVEIVVEWDTDRLPISGLISSPEQPPTSILGSDANFRSRCGSEDDSIEGRTQVLRTMERGVALSEVLYHP
jgi:hypothetical protein